MKRVAIVAGLGFLLMSCSSDGEDVEAQLKQVIVDDETLDITETQADCYAKGIVEAMGEDRINELGVDNFSDSSTNLTEDESAALEAEAVRCLTE